MVMSDGGIQEPRDAGSSTELDLIRSDPEVMDGVPTFVGTRIPVWTIASFLANGDSHERVIAAYPGLTPEHLRQAQRFAATNARPPFRTLGELNPTWVVISRGVLRPARPEALATSRSSI